MILPLIITVLIINALSVDDIIDKVDNNMVYKDMKMTATMNVMEDGEERSMTMDIYMKDEENILIEITASTSGHINRFMKKNDQMWLYIPSAGQSIRIKGHMLKEGFMGSDFSYEDMAENRETSELYSMELLEDDTLYIIKLTAKSPDAPYKMKMEYIAKEIFLPVKEEIYSSTGKLLKEFYISDYKHINGKYIPTRMNMVDQLKQGSTTEILYDDISLNAGLPESYFQKAYLER